MHLGTTPLKEKDKMAATLNHYLCGDLESLVAFTHQAGKYEIRSLLFNCSII